MSLLKQIVLSLLVLAMAAGGWYLYQHRAEFLGSEETVTAAGGGNTRPAAGGRPAGGPGGGRFGAAPMVITAAVELEAVGDQLRAVGTAAAKRQVTVYPLVSGVLTQIAFEAGQRVGEEAVLARLDTAEQEIALDRAKLAEAAARAALDRAERLAKSQNITQVALADAKMAVDKAVIDVRSAQWALDRRTVKAPFAGVVGMSTQAVGDLVGTQTALTTLDDLSAITVDFWAPERFAGVLASGHPVTASAEGLPGRKIAGKVTAVDSRVDETTRSFRVKATLDQGIEGLKPGMSVTVVLDFPGEAQPTVSSLAVQWDRQGTYVWKVDGDVVHRTGVQVVARRSGAVTVVGDLAPTDQVVVEGLQRLREGMTVAVVGGAEPAPPAGPAAPAAAAGRGGEPEAPAAAARPAGADGPGTAAGPRRTRGEGGLPAKDG